MNDLEFFIRLAVLAGDDDVKIEERLLNARLVEPASFDDYGQGYGLEDEVYELMYKIMSEETMLETKSTGASSVPMPMEIAQPLSKKTKNI